MDKKKQKKPAVKRKNGSENPVEMDVKKTKGLAKGKSEEAKAPQQQKAEVIAPQAVEFSQQILHTGQMDGGYEQPVFLSVKGEPVHLGPNTVIVYEQGSNSGNFAFGGNLVMDSSGRIVMAETIYDVKDDGQEEQQFVNAAVEVEETEQDCYDVERRPQQQQQQEYEIVQIVDENQDHVEQDNAQDTMSEVSARWLNSRYDYVVRKLQLDHDAGVKLLHSVNGVLRCVYLTTPAMQLAFNSVPQFLCIETGIEFRSEVSGSNEHVRQTLSLILAEDGNGKSVIVSAGISTLGDNVRWLLETFKSCNPAWRQVRCVLADPGHHTEAIKWCFPGAHVCCNIFQATRWAAQQASPPAPLAPLRSYVEALVKGHEPDASKVIRRLGGHVLNRLPRLLEGDNFTNVLHKGLERMVEKFEPLMAAPGLQPEEFVSFFFEVVRTAEDGRQAYALSRLQDTINSKQSPTDTITQYAYFLIHQQTTLAQRALNQEHQSSNKDASGSIKKYGTSTQECSCLFSTVFRLPCRHILMLTTELKVKTHIPFEPRWTVHHCLFGCELETRATSPSQANAVTDPLQDQHLKQQQQYMMASNEGQVIFCSSSGGNPGGDTIQYTTSEPTGQPA